MRIAVYPGSFDPVTNGHVDIIKRAAKMVDHLVIGVLHNSSKTPLFSAEERVNMLSEVCQGIPNVEIRHFEGLLVDFVMECNATIVVRGLRAVTDFEYELQWAQSNRIVCPQMDTMFLVTNVQYSYLSSSVVREYASHRGDISPFVPPLVAERLKEKYN
ncbi:MAG TPA: pantetheine-phosphate adenylyltransferase [Candidatus Scybalocola faecavium]|nr:pantetheine-phosphate adenylyltransferase [Candidatus Scybalocola faecavium]